MRFSASRLRTDDGTRVAAGPTLDHEIDRRIFRHEDGGDAAPYSSKYEAGLLLEYKLARSGWLLDIKSQGPFSVRLERGGQAVEASGDTVELALCRAALKTLGPVRGVTHKNEAHEGHAAGTGV